MDDAAFSQFLTAAIRFVATDLCPYLTDGPDKAEVIAILAKAKVQWPVVKDAAA